MLAIKGIYCSFELVPLFKRFTYNHKAETFMSQCLLLEKLITLFKYVCCYVVHSKD